MVLTAAEKQRQYRLRRKQDAVRERENKEKDCQRYHLKKQLVTNLTRREHKAKKDQWRSYKRGERARKKEVQNIVTPPQSPVIEAQVPQNNEPVHCIQDSPQLAEETLRLSQLTPSSSAGNKFRGRKKVRRDKAKCYRENLNLKKKIAHIEKNCEKYRKRAQRTQALLKKICSEKGENELTPRAKTAKQLSDVRKNSRVPEHVRKELLFNNTVVHQIKKSVQDDPKKKKITREILTAEIMKRYKLLHIAGTCGLGLTQQARIRRKLMCKKDQKKRFIERFFARDDVSRTTAGKKECVTKNKIKEQRRYLLDTMKTLIK